MAFGDFLGNPLVAGALSLGAGLASGYAKERQTQADYRRRMAELTYRHRLGQMDKSMEKVGGIATPSGETIFPDDPRYPELRAAKDFAAGGGGHSYLQSENERLTGSVGELRNRPDQRGYGATEAGPPQLPPNFGPLIQGLTSREIDPNVANAWFAEEVVAPRDDPDGQWARIFTRLEATIKDAIKDHQKHLDKLAGGSGVRRTYRVTTREELIDFLMESAAPRIKEGYGLGSTGDPSGNAAGTQVAIGPNQFMPKATLDAMSDDQLAALTQRNMGGLA